MFVKCKMSEQFYSSCVNSKKKDKIKWSKILKTTPDKLCNTLQDIYNMSEPSKEKVSKVHAIYFSNQNKTKEEMLNEIYYHVKEFANHDWKTWMNWLQDVNEYKISYFIVNLIDIYALHRIKNIHKRINDKNYKTLVNKLKSKSLTKKQNKKLEKIMLGKMCSCIKTIKAKQLLTKSKINPYAICVSSVYNKRNLPGKPNGPKECQKFDI